MSHLSDSVKPCLDLGHVYVSILTVRCKHRESYETRAAVWVDTSDGDTKLLWERIEEYGPFDDLGYIQQRAGYLATEAVRMLQEHRASTE